MTVRTRTLPLLAALILVLAACTGGDDDGGGGEAAYEFDGEVAGSIYAYGFTCTTGDIVATGRFEHVTEQYPELAVECSESGFGTGQEFLAALQAGTPPDVANVPRNVLGTYVARDLFAPLDDCLSEMDVDLGNFYEAAVNQVTVDGTPYALPEFFNTRVWILNDSVFADADLDPEGLDLSDWEAIADANQQLLQSEGSRVSRIGIDPKVPEFLAMWVRAAGGRLISDDGRESMLDTPEVAEAVEFAYSLIQAHGSTATFNDFRATWDFFGAENQVAADHIGAWPMEQWYLNVLAGNSPDDEITVKPFVGRDGEVVTLADGNSWAIMANTENYEEACAFIVGMTHEDAWVAAAEQRAEERQAEGQPNTGVYSGNRAADDVIFGEIVDLTEYPQFEEAVRIVVDNQANAFALPPTPAAEEFQQALNDAVDRIINGEDVETALREADEEAQAAIDAAGN
ncbi:MAG TPA: extracellular solute-binding protein [Candidatus Angelobacter sp.]|nr:extracellular solute-binding protein [Candidatus Angelobacter sp.]